MQDDSGWFFICSLLPLLPAHPSMSQPLCQTPGTEKKVIQGPFFWWAHQCPSNQHRPPTQNREIHHLGQKKSDTGLRKRLTPIFSTTISSEVIWRNINLLSYRLTSSLCLRGPLRTWQLSMSVSSSLSLANGCRCRWQYASIDGKLPPPQITSIQTHLRISPQDEIGCRHLGVINGKTTHSTYQYSVQ